ncbi:MAG: RluA family pseudouridine synthase [Deltaproteobacteria bacterium]|nr:RluA family pseudouridine synthase [Deltaproteobacteria bacterium]
MPLTRRSVVLDRDAPRADIVVQGLTGATRAVVRGMFDAGCVTVDGARCGEPGARAAAGARVEVAFEAGRRYRETQAASEHGGFRGGFRVAFEDRHLVVVEKPAGMLTVPTVRREKDTLVHLVARHFSRGRRELRRAFIVHRLDRDASGVLVFARSDAVARALKAQFEDRKPEREYAVIVAGTVARDAGTFRSFLATGEDLDQRSTGEPGEGKLAVTHFEVLRRLRGATYLRVRLETGRRNQIRVHFAEAGHPVLGDTRYEPARARHPLWREPRIALHALTLGFVHPVAGARVRVTSDLPRAFVTFLDAAGAGG